MRQKRNTAIISLLLGAAALLGSCASLEGFVDAQGLRGSATAMLAAVDHYEGGRLGGPAELEGRLASFAPFARAEAATGGATGVADPEASATAEPVATTAARPPAAWLLPDEKDLHQERIAFPSVSPLRAGGPDEAIFYLYWRGSLAGKRTILWVPGYGVSDFAFRFIRNFFETELDHNYAILFYTIPGHLERMRKGEKAGEALLSADPAVNLETVSVVLGELERGMSFLRARGVGDFSAWGGSMGAAFLLLLAERERFDHMVLMIPVLDWRSILGNEAMGPVRARLRAAGYPDELVDRAYEAVSPAARPWKVGSTRVLIQYARWDALTPESLTLDFARGHGIVARGYDESHSTILLDRRMLEDYRLFLDGLD
ncbi:MAG TPA: hypothetical protein VMV44_01655 [Rectinemataceae bacterium]|nr:hypothetical protein [Rectinemataceae bacterium]